MPPRGGVRGQHVGQRRLQSRWVQVTSDKGLQLYQARIRGALKVEIQLLDRRERPGRQSGPALWRSPERGHVSSSAVPRAPAGGLRRGGGTAGTSAAATAIRA